MKKQLYFFRKFVPKYQNILRNIFIILFRLSNPLGDGTVV